MLAVYVCICHGVNDETIESVIESGATTMKQLSTQLKVGSQCGKCCQCVKKVLDSKLTELAASCKQVA